MTFKGVWIALIVLLSAAPALAQQSVVEKYRSQYPTPMSKEQLLALERAVASEVHGGLLRKPDGNNCGGYACDIICFSDTSLFDILGSSETTASPQWNPTTNPRGYHCELIATPAPPPTDDSDVRVLEARLAALELRLTDAHTAFAALESRVSALEGKPGTSVPTPPQSPSDLAADVTRIRELLEQLVVAAKRFGLQ